MVDKISTNIRVRGTDEQINDVDLKELIQYIEKKYKIDIKSVPDWRKHLLKIQTEHGKMKNKVIDGFIRERTIIEKILKDLNKIAKAKNPSILVKADKQIKILAYPSELITVDDSKNVPGDITSVTEDIPTDFGPHPTEISTVEEATVQNASSLSSFYKSSFFNPYRDYLPLRHKRLPVSHTTSIYMSSENTEEILKDGLVSVIKCIPHEILVLDNSMKAQYIKFQLQNCSVDYVQIQFKCITDPTPFIKADVRPNKCLKLYNGIAVPFRFKFQLCQNEKDFMSNVCFRVSHHRSDGARLVSHSLFYVRISSRLSVINEFIKVQELVEIPGAYPWQVTLQYGFPRGYVNVEVDHRSFRIVIKKRVNQMSHYDTDTEEPSFDVASMLGRQNVHAPPDFADDWVNDIEATSLTSTEVARSIANEIIDRVLDTFIFKKCCIYPEPHSNTKLTVLFTKVENIGKHQACYDLEFYDAVTNRFIGVKTTRIFTEVFQHTIQIQPPILDLSDTPARFGFCKGYFKIYNNHRISPISAEILMTENMKKLVHIEPLEVVIPTTSDVTFYVRFCARDFALISINEFTHLTIKIILTGVQRFYSWLPPFYYEIIAPCALEYRRIYNFPEPLDTEQDLREECPQYVDDDIDPL